MNQVITDGLALMPPRFDEGLDVWSRTDGRPGSETWATASNAVLSPSDPDFGRCLEIFKTDNLTRVRYMGQTPIKPGMYLRVSARVKGMTGGMPRVRIAAWAGDAAGNEVTGLTTQGAPETITAYGEIITVSAIVGTGARTGVDMVWGDRPTFGHFGIDLDGPNFGQVRIESIRIEDATSVFHRKLMDWVDVKDYGALGDGSTDDRDAFAAADAAARGREVLVPAGTYYIGSNLTMQNPVRFEGKLSMPDSARLALNENFDLKGYSEAFGDDVIGLKKGLQQLFNQSDHEAFDLCGRRVLMSEPLDVQAAVGNRNSYSNRRVIRNGQLSAQNSAGWDTEVHSRSANWSRTSPTVLTNVANAADIPIGSLVVGPTGVGRAVYVRAVNVAQGKVYISAPLWGAPASQTYTFLRFKYLLDFSGFQNLQRFVVSDIEFLCAGRCSGLMLPSDGLVFQIQDCFFTGPKDRGITSHDEGCQGMQIDRCQFLSNEQALPVTQRTTIAFNSNVSDVKVRDNRAVRFLHFGIMGGTGNIVSGNHFFQGDSVTNGIRAPGLVITNTNCKMTFTGNYVDNCHIEWGNEHDANPDMVSEYSFHGLTINSNIFFATDSSPQNVFIIIRPYGRNHYINGMTVCDNLFKKTGGQAMKRVEAVAAIVAPLDTSRTTDLLFSGNTYHGVEKRTENPVVRRVSVGSPTQNWEVDLTDSLPFDLQATSVLSVVPEGAIRSVSNVAIYTMPFATARHGAGGRSVRLNWSQAVKGTVHLTARCDV